jgi:eukaryotic-like serine/threonine-protein kinase
MGEVYRAHDPRLRRDVALKVVRSSLPLDADHVERLIREARAAGRLNHPNILAVFDVGTDAGTPYIVSELLQGESLRDRLDRGPTTYRKALEYAIPMAQALGAAHEKGIWHRDVKPGNVFITTDGRIKLLDFGLAQHTAASAHADPDDTTVSEPQKSARQGTAGYMAPEQVLGQPLDQRADVFALGAVLYEMLTGTRAFPSSSNADARNAVLKSDPVDVREINPTLPDEAAAVVRRCLEKNREERFQSARDLAFHLQQLHRVAEGSLVSPAKRRAIDRRAAIRRRTLLALVAVAVCAAGLYVVRWGWGARPSTTFDQLTFGRGRIGGARFASNDQAVVYSEARPVSIASGLSNRLQVWRIDLADSPQSHRLGYEGADVLAARADLALSLHRRFVGGRRFAGTLARAPIGAPGRPREVAEDVEDADWDVAGENLVIARRLGAPGDTALEYPPGKRLFTTSGAIRFPRMARDGRAIAFLHDPAGIGAGGRVAVVDLAGHVTELTSNWTKARGLSWSPSGDEIWFTAANGQDNRALRAVKLDKRQRVVLEAPSSLTLWDVAADGRALVTRDDEWRSMVGLVPGWTRERDLSLYDATGVGDLSDDGRTLLFADRFGIFTRATDGTPPVALGLDGFADDLSPDGRWVVATSRPADQLVLLPTGAGEPRVVPSHGITSYRGAVWCPDGRRIIFNGVMPGQDFRAYVQDVSPEGAGPPRPLTTKDAGVVSVSPDGRWAAATQPNKGVSLWPVEGGPPVGVPGSEPDDRPVGFSADGQHLWVFQRGEVPARVFRVDILSGRRELSRSLSPLDPAGVYSILNFKITPSGNAYFYSYAGVLSQLYLVRGLK